MHSLDCRFILLFGNIGSSFDVIKVIEIGFKIFFDLILNSDNGIIEILFCNMFRRNSFKSLLSRLRLLFCLRFLLRLVFILLFFICFLIRLTFGVIHFRLRLFLEILINLFRIRLLVLILSIIIYNFLIINLSILWLFLLNIFWFRVGKEINVMLFDFLMKLKLSFYIV